MELLRTIFGEGEGLSVPHICARAFVLFFIALGILRISGRRSFGMASSFDNAVAILLGSILSRAVTGASPFVPVVCASLLLAILHRLVAFIALKNNGLKRVLNGDHLLLYDNGKFDESNMKRGLVCMDDINKQMRLQMNTEYMEGVDRIYLEDNGQMSIIRKPQ